MATAFDAVDLDIPDEDAERDVRLVNALDYVGGLVDGIGDIPVPNVCVASKTSPTIPVHARRRLGYVGTSKTRSV